MRGKKIDISDFSGDRPEAQQVRDRSSLSRLMISEAYRLACRASFLRIQRDLCKFVLSATRLVTRRGKSVVISPILIFAKAFRVLSFLYFSFEHFYAWI